MKDDWQRVGVEMKSLRRQTVVEAVRSDSPYSSWTAL